MKRQFRIFAAIGMALLLAVPGNLFATLAPQGDGGGAGGGFSSRVQSGGDYFEAREFQLRDARVTGRVSMHQTVTAWQVRSGSWNGELLDGLCMVLVRNVPEDTGGEGSSAGVRAPATECYISEFATPAQRSALVSAFMARHAIRNSEMARWRIEPAVIRFEAEGQSVVLHLGLVS